MNCEPGKRHRNPTVLPGMAGGAAAVGTSGGTGNSGLKTKHEAHKATKGHEEELTADGRG